MDDPRPAEIAPFQLFLVPSDADYHTLNEGNEVNRSNITDDATDGFSIMVSLEKAIHGAGENLNSFVGLHFTFRGANDKRRFKVVNITIRFEDEEKPLLDDPEVIKIWPDTEYVWQGMTKEIADVRSLGIPAKAAFGGAEVGVEGKWQREEKFVRNTPARLSGEKTLLKRRAGSHKNAMRIRMSENAQEGSGVLRELRAGILVRRKRVGVHRFKAYIDVKAEADFRYDVVQGLKKLVGAQHVTDPVVFHPGANFFDEDDIAGINHSLPGPDMVKAYGEAAMFVELTNAHKKMAKINGEWKDVSEDTASASSPAMSG